MSGQQLILKLAQYMRPKCHALLLDSGINSDVTVRLNLYQALVLSAMKMHCYLRSMREDRGSGRGTRQRDDDRVGGGVPGSEARRRGREGDGGCCDDPRLVLVALQSAISYLFTLVQARTSTASLRSGTQCR